MAALAGLAGCPAAGDAARNAKLANVHYLLGRDYLTKRNPSAAMRSSRGVCVTCWP